MKKIVILFVAALSSVLSFAQRSATHSKLVNPISVTSYSYPLGRTTAIGDTEVLTHITTTDSITIYTYDSVGGYTTGINGYDDRGFAERYDINEYDSSVRVIGVMARFTGTVNPSSTHSVNFHVWAADVPAPITATMAYSGFPSYAPLDTLTVPFTQLGIGTITDTLKTFYFDSASATLNTNFFVGYDMDYDYLSLSGDTIGLAATKNGERTSPLYTTAIYIDDFNDTTRDTTINVQNATQWSDLTWHDNYTDNDSIFNNLAIFPIVAVNAPTLIKGVTRNNLTFYGNYPNPAVNSTNIKFSLASGAGVTIQVMDMNGRVLQSLPQSFLSSGEHIVPVQTDQLPSGNYLYSIITSSGDGIASKFTVIK